MPERNDGRAKVLRALARDLGYGVEHAHGECVRGSVRLLVCARVHAKYGRSCELRAQSDLFEQAGASQARACFDAQRAAAPLEGRLRSLLQIFEDGGSPDEPRIEQEALREALGVFAALRSQFANRVQACDDLGRARRTCERIAAEQGQHQAIQLLRDVFDHRARGGGSDTPHFGELVDLAGRVGMTPSEHPVRERPQRVEVGALIERRTLQRFGRDTGRGPDDQARAAERDQRAEVDQLAVPIRRHPHVGRTQVAVNQPPSVQEGERRRDVAEQGAGFAVGQRGCLSHVLPFEQLHRVVGADLVDAVVEHTDDSRVIEAGQDLVFTLEGFDQKELVARVAVQALQRALFARRAIQHAIDDAHATGRELFLDHVAVGYALGGRRRSGRRPYRQTRR